MKLLILLAFVAVDAVSLKSPRMARSSEDTATAGNHQCTYNGKSYSEGETLPTRHLCLDCKCSKEFVEPSNLFCEVIDCVGVTAKFEMGCIPVYNDTECCPVSWNCDDKKHIKKCECDNRYFKHYEVKGCTPVYEEGCESCPVRFNCPKVDITKEDKTVCKYKGRNYKHGDTVDVGSPCEICNCLTSYADDGLEVTCISVECPSDFMPPLNDSCHEVYEDGVCCSFRTECVTDEVKERAEKVCAYGGKTYHLGQKIYPEEDPCLICTCSENWTGINSTSCKIHDCSLERRLKMLQKGCLPIYHEATCCPIEFYCGSQEEGLRNTTLPVASSEDIKSGDSCEFKGSYYKLGQILDINHPTHCVTCTCSTPPDFTCIYRSCPRPPNNDYDNCISSYEPDSCCPTYNCKTMRASAPVPECTPVSCPEGCSEVTVHNSCPFCFCQDILCSPPKCPVGCEVQKDVPPNKCPGCDCDHSVPMCAPVKCSANCYEAVNPQGCPMCICGPEPLCSIPKCESGCNILNDVPAGECPRCVCPEIDPSEEPEIQCAPVRCLPTCRETVGESGCPSCVCDPLCSPPKCEPGCHVDPAPTGPCPGCVCGNEKPQLKPLCSPVKCGPLCHEAYVGSDCPTCICDPMCSVPKCESGCSLIYNPETGPCPECVCPIPTSPACPRITCGTLCHEAPGSGGCPTCICQPHCTPPRCEANCHLEFDRTAGPCAACVCMDNDERDNFGIQCSPPLCDPGCRVDFNTKPCPSCTCEPDGSLGIQCSIPKCDPGCRVDYNANPCPSCTCEPEPPHLEIPCSPPKCKVGCRLDNTKKPCPSCVCDIFVGGVQCSIPKCDPWCSLDYNTEPCPSCNCDFDAAGVQCSMPKCDPGCTLDPNTKPCPSCKCGFDIGGVQCSMPKCDPGCTLDPNTKPCPSCKCGFDIGGVQCSMPKCDPGCTLDSNTKPCPSCKCGSDVGGVLPAIQCSLPKCDEGCWVDYKASPCPGCTCEGERPAVPCTLPKCDEDGCHINYKASPCPICVCRKIGVECAPVECEPHCREVTDYGCPSCDCSPLCSIPKCQAGCWLDNTAEPCPTCVCDRHLRQYAASMQLNMHRDFYCSLLTCGSDCEPQLVPSPNERCPLCICKGREGKPLTCAPMQCELPCRFERFSRYGCPTCVCHQTPCPILNCRPGYVLKQLPEDRCKRCVPQSETLPAIQCSLPKCDDGCWVDYKASPCPICTCHGERPTVACTIPAECNKPNCRINYKADPCPRCSCMVIGVECAPVKCEPHCREVTEFGCPSCNCRPQCSTPKCEAGCRLDSTAEPCPTCVCE